ncbi:MAG: leucine-rich repeat domain-containing protein [Spirochaetota bacterium]|nr:leucine-rich repeat domain-containing protein [Spirochaetota bacterium]
MKRLLILFSLLWTFNLFANIDLFKENTVECAIEEAAEVLRNQTQTLKLVVTGELKDNSHWTQLTEAVRAREKFINLDLSKLKGLTKVGGFSECEKLVAITLPDCVTTIDNEAFTQCRFSSIKIPNKCSSIGYQAFKSCSLTSITIPDSVTTIDTYAFEWSGLESVTIGSGVTYLGYGVFRECRNLKNVVISEGTTNIGKYAFANCYNLTNISIPNSITYIGEYAFSRCNKLIHSKYNNGFYLGNKNNPYVVLTTVDNKTVSSFYINENTKVIYNHSDGYLCGTFSDCNNLTSIVLPYGLTCIGSYIFSGCKNLTNITIPDTVIFIGSGAFMYCNKLTYNKYNNGAYLGNKNNPYVVLVKAENSFTFDINKKTKIINNAAFEENRNLTSITIPDSVITIGNSAFYQCSNLESLSIGKGVISIGGRAFYGCTGLTSIIIPDNVKSIGGSAFLKYDTMEWDPLLDIETIVVGNGLTSLDNLPITSALKSITIGSGITSIDNELFKYCENAKIYVSDLKSYLNNFSDNPRVELKIDSLPNDLVIPDGVTSIKSFAFKGHNNFTSVTIPDSVTFVGENAFSDCNNIKTLIVGNGLTSLDNLPLTSALKFITIGNRINSINENTFNLCNDLTIFKVDENNQNYSASEDKKILFNKDKTTLIAYPSAAGDITIPDGVTTITSNAFNGCSNLTSVTFKDTNNWFYTTNSNYTDKMQIDVADTAQNATYLKETYCNYYLYKYLETTITVTADNVTDGISKLSKGGNHTVKVTGEITADTIASIKTALNNNNCAKVNLDLSDTTGLTSIGDNAFSWCKNLTSVVIPDSVTSVDYNAFLICNNIENLVTGNGLTSLNYLPITSALKSITIGNGINSINERTFNSCNNLTVFNVDENNQNYSVSEDGKILFNKDKTTLITYSSAANDVTIPDSVTTVNSGAFVNCKNVETLVIGNGLTSLDNLPITSALKSITIGNNIKSIGYNTFKGCNKLASVTIGNRVTSIDDNAFRDCSSLTSVTIPDSVTEIGNYAFSGCNGLKNIRISKNVTKIKDYTFSNCSNLTSIAIPDSVTSIGNNAFKDCKSLTSVTIGSSVTSIGEYAFRNCSSLTSITIPGSMAKIDSSAFFGCGNLTSVTFEDIKNWSVVISSGKKKKMNVKNVSKNATNLTQNYCGNEWIKE